MRCRRRKRLSRIYWWARMDKHRKDGSRYLETLEKEWAGTYQPARRYKRSLWTGDEEGYLTN